MRRQVYVSAYPHAPSTSDKSTAAVAICTVARRVTHSVDMNKPVNRRILWIAAITAAIGFAVEPVTFAADEPWSAPVGGTSPTVVSPFSPPEHDWLAGHRGVDLAATAGSVVRAPASGIVTFAGRINDRSVVSIDHGELTTSLEPVDPAVQVGQQVSRGEVVGNLGEGGHCSRRCVHWGVRDGDVYLDPMRQLRGLLPILKPELTLPSQTVRSSESGSYGGQTAPGQPTSDDSRTGRTETALAVGSFAAVAAAASALARQRKRR